MRLSKQQVKSIIEASTILGTGGGGRLDSALDTIKNISQVELISFGELKSNDFVITAYGAGGLTKAKNSGPVVADGLQLLESQLTGSIKAVVPVEIGPYSLAAAFEIAAKLRVPVVDGDLVGFRSVPEIFIELVTLADLPRCPLVFGNNEGDLMLLQSASSPERLESIIRDFASKSESNTFVLGYPYSKAQLRKCLALGSVSYCLNFDKKLARDFQLIGTGMVVDDQKQEKDGFTQGELRIKGDKAEFRVIYKNEYLVLLKDEKLLLTCPDFICVTDEVLKLGLNNGDDNLGRQVRIYVAPAIEQWRTAAARKLFSPRNLRLPYPQKVLS